MPLQQIYTRIKVVYNWFIYQLFEQIINKCIQIINYLFNIKDYNYLLEFPKKYSIEKEKISLIDINNKLVKKVKNFMEKNDLYKDGVIVSLSGGVDSMVILAILIRLSKEKPFNIFICSINYNLRKESYKEMLFLKEYCNNYDVKTYFHHLEGTYNNGVSKRSIKNSEISGGRKVFEETSREIRYNGYKEIIQEFNCKGVMVGHHKDDIIENIFTNSMKGHDIMNIEVMKEISNINNVNIFRPLLEFRKDTIYDLAHSYDIPYFKDTTPKWSKRGMMRNEIFPLFDKVFTSSWRKKFKEIGTQSNNWNDTVDRHFVKPWLNSVVYFEESGIKSMLFKPMYLDDINLWTYVLPKMFFKMNENTVRRKSIIKMYNNIKTEKEIKKKVILDSGYEYYYDGNVVSIFKNLLNFQDIKDHLKKC